MALSQPEIRRFLTKNKNTDLQAQNALDQVSGVTVRRREPVGNHEEEIRKLKLQVAEHNVWVTGLRLLRDKDNRNILNPNWDKLEDEIGAERLSNPKTNLFTNGVFRLWDSATVPNGFTVGGSPTISQQTVRTAGDSNNKACRIAAGVAAGSISRTVYCRASSKYKLGGWLYIASGATATVTLTTDGATPVVVSFSFPAATYGAAAWLSFPRPTLDVLDIETPSDATTITIKLEVDANQTCDFSDFQIVRGVRCDPDLVEPDELDKMGSTGNTGSYTPTGTAVLNVTTITPAITYWSRNGAQVHLWGTFAVDPAAAGSTLFRLSLPIASNFGAVTDASGGIVHGPVAGLCGEVTAVVATDDLLVGFIGPDGTQRTFQWWADYRII